jgi:hypothetical protein
MKGKKKLKAPTWITYPINGETLDVLRVWELNDASHKWPEVAILRALTLGAKQLAEDHAVLLQFLNDNQVFSKDVNLIGNQVSIPPGPPCQPPHWDFVLVHGRASTAHVIQVACFK